MTDIEDFSTSTDLIQDKESVLIIKKDNKLDIQPITEVINDKLEEVGTYLRKTFPEPEEEEIVTIPEEIRYWFGLSIIDKKFKLFEITDKDFLNMLLQYEEDTNNQELIKQRIAEL